MLPKVLYEALPYLYIGTGSAMILVLDSPLLWLSGLLLFAAGALAWVTRSRYRRHGRRYPSREYRDAERPTGEALSRYRQVYPLPEQFYEYLPFLYLFAGLLSFQYYRLISPSYTAVVAIVLFTAAGGCAWMMRGYYRGYHRQLVPLDYED